jgi:hypothetical protein
MSSPSSTRAPRNKHVSAGNRTRAACVFDEHSSKELFELLMLLLFGTSTVPRVAYFVGVPYLSCYPTLLFIPKKISRMSEEQIATVSKMCLKALAYLHSQVSFNPLPFGKLPTVVPSRMVLCKLSRIF